MKRSPSTRTRRSLLAGGLAVATVAALTAFTTPTPQGGRYEPGGDHPHQRVCSTPAAGQVSCTAHVVTDAKTGRPAASLSYNGGYTPAQLTSAYGPFGTKAATVAVVDAYANPNAAKDLAAYRTRFGLPAANLVQVNQTGGSISTVPASIGWGQEEDLDLQMVSAISPTSKIIYVGAKSASLNDLAQAVSTAKALGAAVISNSYGAGEFSGEQNLTAWNIPGVAVVASAGDSGYGVEFPAASAGVVAVGGTSLKLTSTGTRSAETVWAGSGSGCSAYVPKPTWQHDTGCARRTVTDVAAVADPNTGVAVYDSYGSSGGANWYVFGGTSVAAPVIAGVYARDGVPAGAPAAALYANRAALFDVTSGRNGSCATTYLCTGLIGYDGPTGNGTPKGVTSPF